MRHTRPTGGPHPGPAHGTTTLVYESVSGAPNPGTFPPPGTLNKQSGARGRLAKPAVPTGACTTPRSPSLSGIRSWLPRPGHLRPGLLPSPPNKEPGLFFLPALYLAAVAEPGVEAYTQLVEAGSAGGGKELYHVFLTQRRKTPARIRQCPRCGAPAQLVRLVE